MEKEKSSFKRDLEKVWFFLWKDNSPKGWLITIIFLFLIIKFAFFPLLSLVTGTPLPLAIVESCSMYHEGNLFSDTDQWWIENANKYNEFQITKENFTEFPFTKGLNKGDILFITGPGEIHPGEVIIFNGGESTPIIHRVVSIENKSGELIYQTMGDNNNGQIDLDMDIREEQIIGKARAKIAPYLGWVKLIFFERQRRPENKGGC